MDDVITVTIDSLRADHCGWQSDLDITPNLSELAAESLAFTSAISPGPRTLSSVPVTHTGVPFAVTNHDTSKYGERVARIRNHIREFETVSEAMQAEGYTTLAFTANPWTSVDNEFDTGFDQFHEVGRTGGSIERVFRGTPLEGAARAFDHWFYSDAWFCTWRSFYDEAIEAIESVDGPVFAWIFLLDTHNPYFVPKRDREETATFEMYWATIRANDPLDRTEGRSHYKTSLGEGTLRSLRKAYRDGVRSVDAFIGRLRSDIDEDTVLLVHSDHGESFGEHGTYGHQPVLYEENVHVPLLLYDGEVEGTVDDVVSTVVIPDMVLSRARGEEVDYAEWTTEYAVSRTESDSAMTIRGDCWKYIRGTDGVELYDLSRDPGETTDRSEEEPDVISEFERRREEYLNSLPAPPSATGSIESEGMRDHLQSLGYLQE
jgi:arylsulfatase